MTLSSPVDRKALQDMITELSNSMTRVDAEKDLQKDILARAQEELEIKKTLVSKLATIYHKQTFDKVVTEKEELEQLYESIFSKEA